MKGAFAERKTTFSRVFTTERIRRRLSQAQISKLLGVSKFTIIAWELGRGLPNHDNMKTVFERLDLSERFLLTGEPDLALNWKSYDKDKRGHAYCPFCGMGQTWQIRYASWNGRIPNHCEWCGREVQT